MAISGVTVIARDWHILAADRTIITNPSAELAATTGVVSRKAPPVIEVRLPAARRRFCEPVLPFQRDMFEFAGVPLQSLRPLSAIELLDCDDLLVLPRAVTGVGQVQDGRAIGWARDLVARTGPGARGRRLYISRAGSRRAIENEAEVLDALAPFGVEVHRLETYAFSQQVRLFAEAELVCGPHGAGFANMIFMPPGSAVVEAMPAGTSAALFVRLAPAVGHAFERVPSGELFDAAGIPRRFYSNARSSFRVDPGAMAAAVRRVLDGRPGAGAFGPGAVDG